MSSVQLATKIDARIKKIMDAVCQSKGFKIGRFIEEAILDKIDELEDRDDIKNLRLEKTIPLSKVLSELKKSGKI